MTNAMLKAIEENKCVWTDEEIAEFEKKMDFAIHNSRIEGGTLDKDFKQRSLDIFKSSKTIEEYEEKSRLEILERYGLSNG